MDKDKTNRTFVGELLNSSGLPSGDSIVDAILGAIQDVLKLEVRHGNNIFSESSLDNIEKGKVISLMHLLMCAALVRINSDRFEGNMEEFLKCVSGIQLAMDPISS